MICTRVRAHYAQARTTHYFKKNKKSEKSD